MSHRSSGAGSLPAPSYRATVFMPMPWLKAGHAAPVTAAPAVLASVQWLRAVAALAVVVFHVFEKLPGKGHVGGLPLPLPGAAGVDVFFCVSGFIMWLTAAQRPLTAGTFLQLRAVRILPLYWLLTTVLLATALALPHLFPRLVLTGDHVMSSYLLVPWRSPTDGLIAPLLVQGWTLAYEAFFYVVFAFCLTFGAALRLRLLTAILIACVLVGFVLQPATPALAVYTNPLLLEFLAGVWVAQLWLTGRLVLSRRVASTLVLLALGGLAATVLLDPATQDRWRVVVWGGPALLLLVAAIAREGDLVRWPRFGVALGDASYALYLLQGFVIAVTAKALSPWLGSAMGATAYLTVTLAATIAVGHFCHRLVERPLTRALRPRSRPINT